MGKRWGGGASLVLGSGWQWVACCCCSCTWPSLQEMLADAKDERKERRRNRRRRRRRREGGGTGLRSRARVTVGCRPLPGKHLKHLRLSNSSTNNLSYSSMLKTMWPPRGLFGASKCVAKNAGALNNLWGEFTLMLRWCQPWLAEVRRWRLGKGVGANLELILLLTSQHSKNIWTNISCEHRLCIYPGKFYQNTTVLRGHNNRNVKFGLHNQFSLSSSEYVSRMDTY